MAAGLENIKLSNIAVLATLGVGGFGRVELVRNSKRTPDFCVQGFTFYRKTIIIAHALSVLLEPYQKCASPYNIVFECRPVAQISGLWGYASPPDFRVLKAIILNVPSSLVMC